jgi:hypothetical protein
VQSYKQTTHHADSDNTSLQHKEKATTSTLNTTKKKLNSTTPTLVASPKQTPAAITLQTKNSEMLKHQE